MIIDSTYFVNEIFIAAKSNDVDAINSKLTGFINKYEPRFLTELLGKELYSDFKVGLLLDPIPQKWIDLKSALADDGTKESPIANYVYYWYVRNQVTTTVGIGETKQKSLNADNANSDHKQVRAWNEMVVWNKRVLSFIGDNSVDYPSYAPTYWSYNHELLTPINTLNL